jgi:hypothetical protein
MADKRFPLITALGLGLHIGDGGSGRRLSAPLVKTPLTSPRTAQGRAVQVDPIKPQLKPPRF